MLNGFKRDLDDFKRMRSNCETARTNEPSPTHDDLSNLVMTDKTDDTLHLLVNASLWDVVTTGLAFGLVHVITGPDHVSALVALANNQPWRHAGALGLKWGAGHALGIVLVALACLALGRALSFPDVVRILLNYLIGILLVFIGVWTLYHATIEYDLQLRPPSKWDSVQCQDATYTLLTADDDSASHKVPAMLTSHSTVAVAKVQTSASLGVGLVHGIAGPGGVLGVLPVVAMHASLVRAVVYLVCFCTSSIVSMGAIAALYGEMTSRGSTQSALTGFRVAAVSSGVSIAVGVIWIVLQACGELDTVLGHHH